MKKETLTASTVRQLEILSDFYDVDYENKIITIVLYYEDIGDALNINLNENKLPQFKAEILQNISSVIDTFPFGFKANIKINCDNLRGYKPDGLLKSLRHSLELFHYTSKHEKNRSFLLAMTMFAVGIFALFMMIIFNNNEWTSEPDMRELVSSIVEIIAWVFIWEAVSLIALTPNEYHNLDINLVNKINEISIRSIKKYAKITAQEIMEHYVEDSRKYKVGTTLFLISGVAFASLTIPVYITTIIDIAKGNYGKGGMLALAVIAITIYSIIQFSAGIVSLLSFTRKKKRFAQTIRFASFVMIVVNALMLAYAISIKIQNNLPIKTIIPFVFTFAFAINYLIGYLLSKKKQ